MGSTTVFDGIRVAQYLVTVYCIDLVQDILRKNEIGLMDSQTSHFKCQ